MTEPVSLADMRQYLRLTASQTADDALIGAMITAARRACEARLNRSVIGGTRTATFAGFPSYPYYLTGQTPARAQLLMNLPGGVVTSITSISYHASDGSVVTLDPAQYEFNAGSVPAALAPIDVWPASFDRPDAVTVIYVVSPLSADDQAVVAQAMKLLVGHWFDNRGSVALDLRGTTVEMPNTVSWLLEPLRVIPFR